MSRRTGVLDRAVIVAFPWVLALAVPSWFYNPPQTLDPWLYHGFIWYYPEYISEVFRSTYYGSRVAWLLPAQSFYRVLPLWYANLLLHVTLLTVALLLVYAIVRRIAGSAAALMATVLFGTYTGTVTAIGWDYPDGALITYELGLLYCIVRRGEGDSRWRWPVLAGVAFGAMVHSNLLALLVGPALLGPLVWPSPNWRHGVASVGWFAAGVLTLTAVLAWWNVQLGGMWAFFAPSIEFIRDNAATGNRWKTPGVAWIANAAWLTVPVLGVIASVWTLRATHIERTARLAATVHLLTFGTMLAFDLAYGSLLQYSYYASWLIPSSFAVMASVARWKIPEPPLLRLVTISACVSLLLVAYVPSAPEAFAEYVLRHPLPWRWLAAIAIPVGVVVWSRARYPAVAVAATCIALIVVNCHVRTLVGYTPPSPGAAKMFQDVHATLDVIHPYVQGERPYFWLGGSAADGPYRGAVASVFLYGYTLLGASYPDPPDSNLYALRRGSIVVVLSDTANVAQRAAADLGGIGFATELAETRRLNVGRHPHEIAILRVTQVQRRASASQ